MAIIAGWGRGTWSQGTWGEPIPVIVTGEAGNSAVGTVTVLAAADVPETGLAATGSVGSVSVVAEAIISPTTVVATGSVGSVTVTGIANFSVSGSAGTTCLLYTSDAADE